MKVFSIDVLKIRKIVHWLLALVSLLMVLSGFGITEYRVIEGISFGIFSKAIAFKTHEILIIPFIALFLLHIYLTSKK